MGWETSGRVNVKVVAMPVYIADFLEIKGEDVSKLTNEFAYLCSLGFCKVRAYGYLGRTAWTREGLKGSMLRGEVLGLRCGCQDGFATSPSACTEVVGNGVEVVDSNRCLRWRR